MEAVKETEIPLPEGTEAEDYEELMYSQLQFNQFLVNPDSNKFLDIFMKDLNLTCFNEMDIFKAREIIELINDLQHWGLDDAAALFKPTLYNLVNTARSRGGFERNALITKKKLESASITQNMQKEGMFKRFLENRRR